MPYLDPILSEIVKDDLNISFTSAVKGWNVIASFVLRYDLKVSELNS